MELESEAVAAAAKRLDEQLICAVEIVQSCAKVIVTGVGKSGFVARQMAATLQSTGVPAVFLHPADAMHGDLGMCQKGDAVVMISKSGSTAELLDLVSPLRAFGVRFIGILGNAKSPLAREMDVALDAAVQKEADPQGFTPTASIVAALSVGHALTVALLCARKFGPQDFHRFHPSGQLGHNLRMRVRDVMHSGSEVAWVKGGDSLKHVVIEMSAKPLGAACVISAEGTLFGIVTDGDVRRALKAHDDIRPLLASDVMTASPATVGPEALVHDALRLMEDRPSQISVLPVVDAPSGVCEGLIRLHDIYHLPAE